MISVFSELISESWVYILLCVFLTLLIRFQIKKNNQTIIVIHRELIIFSFVIYFVILCYTVTFSSPGYGLANYVPFSEIFRYEIGSTLFLKNIMGNILLFIPLGFFISYFLKIKKATFALMIAGTFSFLIEFIQSKIDRVYDIDDIILNMLGAFLGFFIFYFLEEIRIRISKKFMSDTLFYFILGFCLIILVITSIYLIRLEVIVV